MPESRDYAATGGLRWHARALLQYGAWTGFRTELSLTLGEWQHSLNLGKTRSTGKPSGRPLLLLGPSAGWTLPTGFAQSFSRVIAVDIDPWAHTLFRLRHRPRPGQLVWLRQDFMRSLPALLESFPDAAVLFSNTLGQQGLLDEDPHQTEARLEAIATRLQHRDWFSYHDRLSLLFGRKPEQTVIAGLNDRLAAINRCPHPDLTDTDRLANRLLAAPDNPSVPTVTDHLTARLLPAGAQRHYHLLPLSDTQYHVIEWGFKPVSALL